MKTPHEAIGLIPSRMASTRLPNKPLLEIAGVPMIVRVYLNAIKSQKLTYVAVCTDSEEIADAIRNVGGNVVMTSPSHQNGTTRIAEAASILSGVGLINDETVIIDIQGDDPLVHPERIDLLVETASQQENAHAIVLSVSNVLKTEMDSPNVVKVIPGERNVVYALTRSNSFPYPFRDSGYPVYKHLSTIAFPFWLLRSFARRPVSRLEETEGIELCRALANGLPILFHFSSPSISVDTPEDLERVRQIVNGSRSD